MIVQSNRRYVDDVDLWTYDAAVLGWDAQRQAHQLLQSQRNHQQQLYGSLLAAAAAAAVSQRAMLVQRQATPIAGITAALPDDRPVKKSPGIWSPAADIENNNNNNNNNNNKTSNDSNVAAKWKVENDQANMRCEYLQ